MTDATRTDPDAGDFGTIIDAHTVRFVRDLPGPVERVWEYLTKAELTATWLYGNEVPQTVGEEFGSSWEGEDGEPGGTIRLRVQVYDAPRVLEVEWAEMPSPTGTITDSFVRFELTPVGDRVRLTLTHRALPAHAFPSVAAGWHAHLDVLRAVLSGVEGPDAETRYEALKDRYSAIARESASSGG
jgi:uncharacterized protein YndB with AHSA1/START domain